MGMIETMTDKLLARKEGGVGWITFNNIARHNAVSMSMWEAIPVVLKEFENDPEIRCVVLHGAGEKAFVSGADISEFKEKRSSEEAVKAYNDASDNASRALMSFPKPMIAMIRGYCYGGGVGIAVSADIRICAEDAKFSVPAAKLGLGYRFVGIKRLADVVGASFTSEIFFTARAFTAKEAETMGLVNRVVPVAELESYVKNYAETIAGNAPLTIAAVKAAVKAYTTDPDKRDMARVDRMVDDCFKSEDYTEGRTAFMEKRKPRFKGR